MARVAEELVEEWLNRKSYFTIRGVRVGNSEIDLLAVSPRESAALHVEVSVSTRPMGWMSGDKGAGKREPEQVHADVRDWVRKKYVDAKPGDGRIADMRETLWPGIEWERVFVHGKFKHLEELDLIEAEGVKLVNICDVLAELGDRDSSTHTTSSEASDIADLAYLCRLFEG